MTSPPPSDAHYNANARPECETCGGKGMLTYYWDMDDAKNAPCPKCFPEDRWATETAERWNNQRHME